MAFRLSRKGYFSRQLFIIYGGELKSLFCNLLIGVEGAKTPAGVRGRGDPGGASAEEAPRHARGKRSAWSVNQQTC
jgi:hypothetical protein